MKPRTLPVTDTWPALFDSQVDERSDAARNRRLLLDAAAVLIAEVGADGLTMDAVAKAAGVGKGTVFRRFSSRAGLMRALLDHSERDLQNAFMFGPPPLGPGAPPIERIVAFGRERLALIPVQGEIQRAAEDNDLKHAHPAYMVSVNHLSMLLRQAGVDGNLRLLVDALLAPLDATLVLHQQNALGATLDDIADNWEQVARAVVT